MYIYIYIIEGVHRQRSYLLGFATWHDGWKKTKNIPLRIADFNRESHDRIHEKEQSPQRNQCISKYFPSGMGESKWELCCLALSFGRL